LEEWGIIITMSGRQERRSDDVCFEREVHAAYGQLCELFFYTKLVGVTDSNWDRTSRQAAIRNLAQAQPLYFQPDSVHEENAILMVNANGRGIGYLETPIAKAVLKSLRDGREWHAHVRRVEPAGRSQSLDVVILLLLMVTPERYTELVQDRGMLQSDAALMSLPGQTKALTKDFSIEWTLFAVFLLGVAITLL
jgi:hypothetical protein